MKFNKLTVAVLLTTVLVSTSVSATSGSKVEPRQTSQIIFVDWYYSAIAWFNAG